MLVVPYVPGELFLPGHLSSTSHSLFRCSRMLGLRPMFPHQLTHVAGDSHPSPEYKVTMQERIEGFHGEHEFLSNFVPARVVLSGVTYPTVEHAYQAAKSLDLSERVVIEKARGPGQAKKLGQLIQCRPDWEAVKEDIMRDLLIQKFAQPAYAELLLATGDAYLEETNWWKDRYWGVCKGTGLNRLGHLLMEIRADLRGIA